MKYIRGFLMAWGFFCWIPCPYRKWKEEDRPAMLAMLPLVGTFLGILTGLVWLILSRFEAPPMLAGAVICGAYFLMTGFIHLDGFMDCSDAVLPRHPDQERRREILKDSHVGAFGVIALTLMLLIFASCAGSLGSREILISESTEGFSASPGGGLFAGLIFAGIMTVSRGCGAFAVLTRAPMKTSQYVSMKRSAGIPALIVTLLVAAAAAVFVWNMPEGTARPEASADYGQIYGPALLLVLCVTALASWIDGITCRRSLGGMNGDIAGHMIVTGEMFGLLAAALVMGA